MKRYLSVCFMVSLSCALSWAQIGIFDANINIGEPAFEGQASFDSGSYTVESVGHSLGRGRLTDQFHYVYTQMSGSFAIEGDIFPVVDPGRAGFMIRQDLDADSKHVSFMRVSGTFAGSNTNALLGSLFPTFRTAKGGGTSQDGDPEPGGFVDARIGPIRIERIGNSFHLYTLNISDQWVFVQTEVVPMDDPVYVGMAATADNNDAFGEFEFTGVNIIELPFNVIRNLPTDDIQSGAALNGITLTASARSGQTVNAVVTEVPPKDGAFSNVSATGGTVVTNPNGTITWTLDNFSGNATLTYNAVLGPRGSAAWQGTFNDGINRVSYIGGETILPKVPTFKPQQEAVSVGPDEIIIFELENFRQFSGNEGAFGLGIDPRVNSGIYIMNVAGGNSAVLEFPITIEQAGTYYFFGRVRGEDGNSDSWHFEMDLPPAGTDATRWDVGSAKTLVLDYVSSTNPALNPRPFDLEAGEHFIMVSNREDSAQMDYIAITAESALNFTLFNELTGVFAAPVAFTNINAANVTPKRMANGEAYFEAEEGNLIVTPANGSPHFNIFTDPTTSNSQFVNATANPAANINYENRIDYVFEVTEPGTYRVIANTRTISGSDDSFWVEMDGALIPGNTINEAFGGSGIQDNSFHSSWVFSNTIPDLSWDLDAGVHTFNIYAREDGTQIDWLLVTNDLDQDPTTRTPAGGVGVDEFMLY